MLWSVGRKIQEVGAGAVEEWPEVSIVNLPEVANSLDDEAVCIEETRTEQGQLWHEIQSGLGDAFLLGVEHGADHPVHKVGPFWIILACQRSQRLVREPPLSHFLGTAVSGVDDGSGKDLGAVPGNRVAGAGDESLEFLYPALDRNNHTNREEAADGVDSRGAVLNADLQIGACSSNAQLVGAVAVPSGTRGSVHAPQTKAQNGSLCSCLILTVEPLRTQDRHRTSFG